MSGNQPMYVAELSKWIDEASRCHNPDPEADAGITSTLNELRRLAVSAVLQLEALKEEVHRLAGDKTNDVRTVNLLRHTSQLINKMRFGE